jgi:protein tyrosine/serine phosphatase
VFLNGKAIRAYTAALAIGFWAGTPAIARPIATAESAKASAPSKIHIDNFGRINQNYYRGGRPESGDYAALASLGVKTIIDLTSDDTNADERQRVEGLGMSYVRIPMTTHEPPTAAQQQQFLSIVNDPQSQPVFVHCVGGRHRTGVMTAIYRITQDGWTAEQAFKEMKNYDFGLDFLHREFKQFVFAYPALLAQADAAHAAAK